jgi:DNA-binding response OmpR family regulator
MAELEPPANTATVLSLSRQPEDHLDLVNVLAGAESPNAPDLQWEVAASATVDSAMSLLQESRIPVVLCEADLGRDTWKRLLDRLPQLDQPPLLIVGSRAADDSLWAEALNLGAYDVLIKPLEPAEVMRTLNSAWLRWNRAYAETSVTPVLA